MARQPKKLREHVQKTVSSTPTAYSVSLDCPQKASAEVYDRTKNRYFELTEAGEWLPIREEHYKPLLRTRGYSKNIYRADTLSLLEAELMRIQREQSVAFSCELAGYKAGVHVVCGQKILVTKAPNLPEPAPGRWPILQKYFRQLFHDFQPYFFGWIQSARRALAAGPPWRSGQVLILAGPGGCGKNLCQAIITEILGGRAAKPYRYMTGETTFNRELLASEHLVIQDESAQPDIKARRLFGSRVKDFTVNELQSWHPKIVDAVTLTPFWRMSISLNEEPENLQILPPLDASIVDKMMLFRCKKTVLPLKGDDPRERAEFWNAIKKEVPAFLHFLKTWKLPPDLLDSRFGVTAVLDPSLAAEINSLSPEFKLWSLIQVSGIIPNATYGWCGPAEELEILLREKFPYEFARVCTFHNACAVFLGRLMLNYPDRIRRVRGADNTKMWRLLPPAKKS